MEVTDGDYLAAVVWFNQSQLGMLECHAVAAPQYRGVWLNRSTIDSLMQIISITGCRGLVAQVNSPLHKRIWEGLGFKIFDKMAVLLARDTPYGISC